MADFTKGPWVVGNEMDVNGPLVVGTETGGGLIARMAMPPCDDNDANAHLIAAAPDMYAALLDLLDEVGPMKPTSSLVAVTLTARAAVAKAEGK